MIRYQDGCIHIHGDNDKHIIISIDGTLNLQHLQIFCMFMFCCRNY